MESAIYDYQTLISHLHNEVKKIQSRTGSSHVYISAITNNVDKILPIHLELDDVDFIMFTDDDTLLAPGWNVIHLINSDYVSPFVMAKFVKVMALKFMNVYDRSIWIDGNIVLKEDLFTYFDPLELSYCMLKHPQRNCIYDEIDQVVKQNKESIKKLDPLLKFLKHIHYPINNGLIAGGVIYRKHNDRNQRIFQYWFDLILEYSNRDQLTFNLATYLLDEQVNYCNLDIHGNRFFEKLPHGTSAYLQLKRFIKYTIIKRLSNR